MRFINIGSGSYGERQAHADIMAALTTTRQSIEAHSITGDECVRTEST